MLIALVVVMLLVAGYLVRERASVRAEGVELKTRVAKAAAAIKGRVAETASLTEQLARLESAPPAQHFPPRAEALNLGTALATFAAERGLRLSSLDSSQISARLAEVDHPAIGYSLVARGPAEPLIDMLKLVDGFTTEVVRKLEFSRDVAAGGEWAMSLDVVVFYENEVEAGS